MGLRTVHPGGRGDGLGGQRHNSPHPVEGTDRGKAHIHGCRQGWGRETLYPINPTKLIGLIGLIGSLTPYQPSPHPIKGWGVIGWVTRMRIPAEVSDNSWRPVDASAVGG